MRKFSSSMMILILLAGLMSCSEFYSFNPNYNKKAKVLSHLKFDEPPKSIVKVANKKYLLVDDFEFREIDGNTNQTKVLAEKKFKGESVQIASEFDNNLLVVTYADELIKAYILNKNTLEVIKSKELRKDDDDDLITINVEISESKKYASIVYGYDSPFDTKEYGVLSFDNELKVIADKKWDIEDDICDDGKYYAKFISGHFIDNQGVTKLIVPIEDDDRWTLRVYSLNGKDVSKVDLVLPEKVGNFELDDKDFRPRHSKFLELKNGDLLIATIVTENYEDLKLLNIVRIDKNLKKINELNYRMDEAKAKEIFASKEGKASLIQGMFEDNNGYITLFVDCVKEQNMGARSESRRNPVATRGNSSMIACNYFPISILNFDNNLKLNWDKYIKRDFSCNISNSGEVFGYINSLENKFTFFKENDVISFTHRSEDEEAFKNAKYTLRSINSKGELLNPIPLFESGNYFGMIGGMLYKEDDGSYSYFTSYKTTISYDFDYINVLFEK